MDTQQTVVRTFDNSDLVAQLKAIKATLDDMTAELNQARVDQARLEERAQGVKSDLMRDLTIKQITDTDETLATTASILQSVPGIGPVARTMLFAEMPELGQTDGAQATELTRLTPIA